MSASAHDVAAALRERVPGLLTMKLHKLLYYSQGHHLATFGEPLFRESISAWDMGPVVGEVWHAERVGERHDVTDLSEGALNTVGYVVSRYGGLTGGDLGRLTHTEPPWRRADESRPRGSSARIEVEWIRDYFTSMPDDDEDQEPLGEATAIAALLSGAERRRADRLRPDDAEEIRARLVRAE